LVAADTFRGRSRVSGPAAGSGHLRSADAGQDEQSRQLCGLGGARNLPCGSGQLPAASCRPTSARQL